MADTANKIEQILADIRLLDSEQQRLLLERLEIALQQKSHNSDLSILSLRGLGREIWEELDAQEYVRQERASWPG